VSRDESKLAQLVGNLNERPCRTVDLPGREGESVGMWALTVSESQRARKRAYDFVQTTLKFSALDLEYDEQRAIQECIVSETLAVALRDPERPIDQWAADGADIRDRLSLPEIEALWAEYLTFVAERSPLKDIEDPEGFLDELVTLVAQNFPIVTKCSHLARPSLTVLLLTALDRLASGTKGSSSGGSSPAGSAAPCSAE
jgi:hypothetical protein